MVAEARHVTGAVPSVLAGRRALVKDASHCFGLIFCAGSAALSIDLDGYDVSGFSRVDGTIDHVDPETPLSSGPCRSSKRSDSLSAYEMTGLIG